MSNRPTSHIARILAPVDFSAASEVSSLYALQLARVFGAEIVFLYVIPESSLAAKLFFPPLISLLMNLATITLPYFASGLVSRLEGR